LVFEARKETFRALVRFSASSLAFISECGTATNRCMKFVNLSKSPVGFFAGALERFGIGSFT
jgi:hypothetical protein